MNFFISLYSSNLNCPNSISDLKYQKFDVWIFPGISGSGFFPEKNIGQTWARSNSVPNFYPLLLHKSSKHFDLLE